MQSSDAVSTGDIDQSPAIVQQRLRTWLGPLSDHDLVLVINSAGEIIYLQPGQPSPSPENTAAAIVRAKHTQGR